MNYKHKAKIFYELLYVNNYRRGNDGKFQRLYGENQKYFKIALRELKHTNK